MRLELGRIFIKNQVTSKSKQQQKIQKQAIYEVIAFLLRIVSLVTFYILNNNFGIQENYGES